MLYPRPSYETPKVDVTAKIEPVEWATVPA